MSLIMFIFAFWLLSHFHAQLNSHPCFFCFLSFTEKLLDRVLPRWVSNTKLNRRCTSTAWSTQVGWMNVMWLQSEEGKEVKNTAVSLWIDLILKHHLKRKPKTKTGVFLLLDELEWILLTLPLIHPYLFDAYNHRYTVPHPPSPFQFFHFFTSI